MRYLILVGDGMADFPLEELDGRTPLEAANTPAMDEVARRGITGQFHPIPEGLPAGSDIGNLSLFGYNPRTSYSGRAPLEAARQGIRLQPNQVAFRCNLVTLQDGHMASFTSGHIPTEEATVLITDLGRQLADNPVRFVPGVSYRHLTIVDAGDTTVQQLLETVCTPPHDISDQTYEPHLPHGPGAALLLDLMNRSREILADHPVNAARTAEGKPCATSIWLWGQGSNPEITPYKDRFGLTGRVISAVDLVKGIGVCAGLDIADVPGATGYLGTDYQGKVAAALDALECSDMAYLHVEAPDETAHEGRTDLKIQAIEEFDSNVVAPCLEAADKRGDCRILVAPDHITAITTKTHAAGPVPFTITGPGIEQDTSAAYNEAVAAASSICIRAGYALIPAFLTEERLDTGMLAQLDARAAQYA